MLTSYTLEAYTRAHMEAHLTAAARERLRASAAPTPALWAALRALFAWRTHGLDR